MPPQSPMDNKRSDLLSDDDNQRVFRLLGNRCQAMATGVVQLLVTEPPHHRDWVKKDCGVLCFVKDNIKKNYFFRLFCPRKNSMLWEHEMYNNMEYSQTMAFLHTFEGEEYMVGFNFSSADEAKCFYSVVDHKVLVRKKRVERRQHRQAHTLPRTPQLHHDSHLNYRKVPDQAAKLAKRRRNITKADIGNPLNFQHLSHVGWNPDSGFDINVQDETLKRFFDKAGVSEKQLADRDTREFIYDFIAKHGGRDAVVENADHAAQNNNNNYSNTNNNNNSHGVVKSPPPQTVGYGDNSVSGPPIPPRGSARSHVRAAPPPPPPLSMKKSSPPGGQATSAPQQPPPAPPMTDFVPPVPPPMPVDLNNEAPVVPPPMPQVNNTLNTAPADLNSALMDSIRKGATLKPVEDRKPVTPTDDSRGDLLSEIRKGFKLKPVDEREVKPMSAAPEQAPNDLAGALARALAERSKAIHSEDDDDDEDSNDDEWED